MLFSKVWTVDTSSDSRAVVDRPPLQCGDEPLCTHCARTQSPFATAHRCRHVARLLHCLCSCWRYAVFNILPTSKPRRHEHTPLTPHHVTLNLHVVYSFSIAFHSNRIATSITTIKHLSVNSLSRDSNHPSCITMLTTSSSSSSRSHSTSRSSRSTSPAAAACAPLPGTADLHKQFGRDTALGRQLFNIYNQAKLTYDPNPPQLICRPSNPLLEHQHKQRTQATQRRSQLTSYKTKTVTVRKLTDEDRQAWKLQLLEAAGRKKSGVESAEVVREIERARREVVEERRGLKVPSAEERKRQLQERMSGVAAMREKMQREKLEQKEEKEQLQTRQHDHEAEAVHELVREIDERQDFLAEMIRNGRGSEVETAIKAEIAQLMRPLSLHDRQ